MSRTILISMTFGLVFGATAAAATQEAEIKAVDMLPEDAKSDIVTEVTAPEVTSPVAEEGALSAVGSTEGQGNSEFDNASNAWVKPPVNDPLDPNYQDSEFGELLYNEASIPTRLEVLRLLSKDTPSLLVFLQAISMGLGIDDVLDAAVRYDPDRGRDFAQSAVSILPLVSDAERNTYSGYRLDDMDRDEERDGFLISEVGKRFFDDREVLLPHPDWIEGQFHFAASAAELNGLAQQSKEIRWYRSDASEQNSERPIFVSLYEHDKSIVIDGHERIADALDAQGEDVRLPVVFIYNQLDERPLDQLDYPKTVRGLQQAFAQEDLMVTPAPEWQIGEYHILAQIAELTDLFDIPEEDDFEPEHWQRLLDEARKYKVADTSLLGVFLSSGDENALSRSVYGDGAQYAQYDDPRTEENFPFVEPEGEQGERVSMQAVVAEGVIINRPDLIAALDALGVIEVPMAFYYIDAARVKPYRRGPRGLISLAIGAGAPPRGTSGGGFGPPPVCASPPCNN